MVAGELPGMSRRFFSEREAKLDRDAKERGRPRKCIKERLAEYNSSCSHTIGARL